LIDLGYAAAKREIETIHQEITVREQLVGHGHRITA